MKKLISLSNYLYSLSLVKESNIIGKLIKESGKKERNAVYDAARNNKFLGYTDKYDTDITYHEYGYTEAELGLIKNKKDYISDDIKKSFNVLEKALVITGCALVYGEAEYSLKADTIFDYLLSEGQSQKVFKYLGLAQEEFGSIITNRKLITDSMIKLYEEYEEKKREGELGSLDRFVTNDVVYSFDNGYSLVYVPSANSVLSDSTVSEENKNGSFSKDREREGNLMGMCLGSGSKLYHGDSQKIYSIRNHKDKPKVTIRVDGSNELQECKAMANNVPSIELTTMIRELFLKFFKDVSPEKCSDYRNLPPTDLSAVKSRFEKLKDSSVTEGYGKFWYKDKRTPEIKDYIDELALKNDFRLISSSFPSEGPEYFEGLAERCAATAPEKTDFFISLKPRSEVNTSWKYYKKKDWCIDAVKRLVASDSHRSLFFSLALFEHHPYKDFASDDNIKSFMSSIKPPRDGDFANDLAGFVRSIKKVYGASAINYLTPEIFFSSGLKDDDDLGDIAVSKSEHLSSSKFFKYKLHADSRFSHSAIRKSEGLNASDFFKYELHKDDRFLDAAIRKSEELNPFYFFKYELHKDERFRDLAIRKSEGLASSEFFKYELHKDERFLDVAIRKSKRLWPSDFFEYELHKDERFLDVAIRKSEGLGSSGFFGHELHKDERFRDLAIGKSEGLDTSEFFKYELHKDDRFLGAAISMRSTNFSVAIFAKHATEFEVRDGYKHIIIPSLVTFSSDKLTASFISIAKKLVRDGSFYGLRSFLEAFEAPEVIESFNAIKNKGTVISNRDIALEAIRKYIDTSISLRTSEKLSYQRKYKDSELWSSDDSAIFGILDKGSEEFSLGDLKTIVACFDDLSGEERVEFLNLIIDSKVLETKEAKILIPDLMRKVDYDSLQESELFKVKEVGQFLGKFSRRLKLKEMLIKIC